MTTTHPGRPGTPVTTRPALPVAPSRGVLEPVPLDAVRIDDGVWARAQAANASGTLRHCLEWTERLGWLASFDRVATGTTTPDRPGWNFSDSEAYKLLEALAWESARTGEAWVEQAYLDLSARVVAAQDPDGYLNTCFGHAHQEPRWSDLPEGHELYCLGHLMQAAVARVRTAGEDALVLAARRAADLVCEVFGPQGRHAVCGHPEVEVGLLELGRALGVPAYVDMAELFVTRRGHGLLGEGRFGAAYFQDDVPVARAEVLRGHAVRALYLLAAAVDVAVERADLAAMDHLQAQWARTVARRTHVTGGMGSRHEDESFGEDWELPPDRAYCETCAGVGSLMVSWRLLLATGEVAHADLMERTLFNVVAASPTEDGRAFYYANTLHLRRIQEGGDPSRPSARASTSDRAPWFDVSCCPTNVARTLASLGAYVATTARRSVQLHQYAAGRVALEVPDAGRVELEVVTTYPATGTVAVRVLRCPDVAWSLDLRVPSWAEGARLRTPVATREAAPGYAVTHRVWAVGDEVVLELPVRPRVTRPDPRIDAVRGCVVVERGPEVLCLEGRALPGGDLDGVVFEGLEDGPRGSDGQDGEGAARARLRLRPLADRGWGYAPERGWVPQPGGPVTVALTPYRRWGEGGATTMRVWLPLA